MEMVKSLETTVYWLLGPVGSRRWSLTDQYTQELMSHPKGGEAFHVYIRLINGLRHPQCK